MTNHFIFDFETLGQDVNSCPIIDCSYVIFDWNRFTSDNPYTINELLKMIKKSKLDIVSQVKKHKFVVEQSSVEWWKEQGVEAREKIKPRHDDVSLEDFMGSLLNYCDGQRIKYWWSRSNTFDPMILARCAYVLGLKNRMDTCLPYWAVRDTRTFIDAKFNFNSSTSFCPIRDSARWNRLFVKHSSTHDIMADILRLQALMRVENDMELPE
jgi:hypothetical protein